MIDPEALNSLQQKLKILSGIGVTDVRLDLLTERERRVLAELTGVTSLQVRNVEYCKHCSGTWPQHIAEPMTAQCQCDYCCQQPDGSRCATFELRRD